MGEEEEGVGGAEVGEEADFAGAGGEALFEHPEVLRAAEFRKVGNA